MLFRSPLKQRITRSRVLRNPGPLFQFNVSLLPVRPPSAGPPAPAQFPPERSRMDRLDLVAELHKHLFNGLPDFVLIGGAVHLKAEGPRDILQANALLSNDRFAKDLLPRLLHRKASCNLVSAPSVISSRSWLRT